MEDKSFIPWGKKQNQDSEETDVALDLSLSLAKTSSSSSSSTGSRVPFIPWSFIHVGGTSMIEVKKQDSDEADVPLDLSLSLGKTLSSSSASTDTSVAPLREKGLKRTMNFIEMIDNGGFIEKSSDSFLWEVTKTEDVSLELSLSLNKSPRFEVGECSNHHNLQNDNSSMKKRQTMTNPKLVTNKRNKRRKVEKEELRMTELRLGHDPWRIRKKLTVSDVGNHARLMVGIEVVNSHILPHWNADQKARIKEGMPVLVWDCDTNTQHGLVFKQWNERANVFINNWTKNFVKRRELKVKDEIGLYWDVDNSRFKFSLLRRAPLQ